MRCFEVGGQDGAHPLLRRRRVAVDRLRDDVGHVLVQADLAVQHPHVEDPVVPRIDQSEDRMSAHDFLLCSRFLPFYPRASHFTPPSLPDAIPPRRSRLYRGARRSSAGTVSSLLVRRSPPLFSPGEKPAHRAISLEQRWRACRSASFSLLRALKLAEAS